MKTFIIAAVLVLNCTAVSFADDVLGRAELTLQSDSDGPSGSIDIREVNGQILGQGFSLESGTNIVSLTRTTDGVKGYSLNRFFNITCGADSCNDQGSANMDLALKRTATGFTLDGVLNFVSVHVDVSDSAISVQADSSFELSARSNGSFSGQGVNGFNPLDSYEADLTSSGTLEGLRDPAVFIATILNAFVR